MRPHELGVEKGERNKGDSGVVEARLTQNCPPWRPRACCEGEDALLMAEWKEKEGTCEAWSDIACLMDLCSEALYPPPPWPQQLGWMERDAHGFLNDNGKATQFFDVCVHSNLQAKN